jgi:O-antigen/teichoic acid export membrane protein
MLTVGDKWLQAVIVIQVLASVFALHTLASSLQPLAMAMGQTRALFRRDVVNLVIRMPLIIIGLYAGGLVGILAARVISGLAGTLINLALVNRLIGVSIGAQLAANGRSLVAAGAMVAAVAGLNRYGLHNDTASAALALGAQFGAGAFVYVAVITVLWLVAGRPSGPESALMELMRGLTSGPASGRRVDPAIAPRR